LASPLGLKAEEDYVAFAIVDGDGGNLSLEAVGAGEVAAAERGVVARIAGEDAVWST